MEPERTSTHTHIERERRGGSGIAFIVGGLVVAVAVIAYFVLNGGVITGGGEADTSINVEATSETLPAPAEGVAESEAAPAEDSAATETAPATPAQN
jgi:hypothetical protein